MTVGVRPGGLSIDAQGIPTRLYLSENLGETRLMNLKLGDVLIKMRTARSGELQDGETVPVSFDPESIHLFDADTGLRVDARK